MPWIGLDETAYLYLPNGLVKRYVTRTEFKRLYRHQLRKVVEAQNIEEKMEILLLQYDLDRFWIWGREWIEAPMCLGGKGNA